MMQEKDPSQVVTAQEKFSNFSDKAREMLSNKHGRIRLKAIIASAMAVYALSYMFDKKAMDARFAAFMAAAEQAKNKFFPDTSAYGLGEPYSSYIFGVSFLEYDTSAADYSVGYSPNAGDLDNPAHKVEGMLDKFEVMIFDKNTGQPVIIKGKPMTAEEIEKLQDDLKEVIDYINSLDLDDK